jgi:orotidine-5'-phosphate decarboxylase
VNFPDRFAKARAQFGPAVWGLDPSGDLLRDWGLGDTPDGLERFVDIVAPLASEVVGVVKPQSAFYERHGWKGVRALARLVAECRAAGVLVLLDVKRGDVGSTNTAYAEAYLGEGAGIPVDAITVTPYLGLGAMGAFFDRAVAHHNGLFVVTRSSNPEGRPVQEARHGARTVEEHIVDELSVRNHKIAPDAVGPFGAVFGPTHEPPTTMDLRGMGGLFLAPGVGAQGATLDDVARCFADCPERVLPSSSRAILAAGPDRSSLRDAAAEFARAAAAALDA